MARVEGPLEPYARGLGRKLAEQGYSRESAARHLRLMGQLSLWLSARGLDAGALTWSRAEEFVSERRAAGCGARVSLSAMGPLLDHLRGAGAVCLTPVPAAAPADQLLAAYGGYLAGERALAERSIGDYARVARQFLAWRSRRGGGELALAQLTAGDVTAFVLEEHGRGSAASARRVVTGLRSLLRYLHVEGHIAGPLAPAVLAVPGWRGSTPERGLAAGEVARLLASFDRRTALGRRDYAMVMVMARLGLRAGEVAAIELDDIDWRAGELTIAGKGDRRERLPVPADVGQALAGYCQRGGPAPAAGRCSCGPGLRAPRCRPMRSPAQFTAPLPGPGCLVSGPTGCATPPRPRCCELAAHCSRSVPCCASGGRRSRRSTPRSARLRCAWSLAAGQGVQHEPAAPGGGGLRQHPPGARVQA
jgi:integrase/recombinase XerD